MVVMDLDRGHSNQVVLFKEKGGIDHGACSGRGQAAHMIDDVVALMHGIFEFHIGKGWD